MTFREDVQRFTSYGDTGALCRSATRHMALKRHSYCLKAAIALQSPQLTRDRPNQGLFSNPTFGCGWQALSPSTPSSYPCWCYRSVSSAIGVESIKGRHCIFDLVGGFAGATPVPLQAVHGRSIRRRTRFFILAFPSCAPNLDQPAFSVHEVLQVAECHGPIFCRLPRIGPRTSDWGGWIQIGA
jgi:hypothetical protein